MQSFGAVTLIANPRLQPMKNHRCHNTGRTKCVVAIQLMWSTRCSAVLRVILHNVKCFILIPMNTKLLVAEPLMVPYSESVESAKSLTIIIVVLSLLSCYSACTRVLSEYSRIQRVLSVYSRTQRVFAYSACIRVLDEYSRNHQCVPVEETAESIEVIWDSQEQVPCLILSNQFRFSHSRR